MGCNPSKTDRSQPDASGRAARRRKKGARNDAVNLSNNDENAASPRPADSPPQSATPADAPVAPIRQSLEAKKMSINPNAPAAISVVKASNAAAANSAVAVPAESAPAAKPLHHGPITGTIDPGKKVTLRQTVQLAIQIAKQQREKIGKFRRDERHSVMELYELMGLENDAPIAPLSEYQQQLSRFTFPPENMHMLRDVDVIDERTVVSILGEEEYLRRKNEGTVEVSTQKSSAVAAPRRAGVSAEVKKADPRADLKVLKATPKTIAQTEALTAAIKKTILFRGLDKSELDMLFNAFEAEDFDENTIIFEKGDDGDKFYLIEAGRCQILLTDDDGHETGNLFVGQYDTFGELGVMYGTPRAATIIAVLPTKTWWIDRDTYRSLLLVQTVKKRERFLQVLNNIKIFEELSDYERTRIADVVEGMDVRAGTVIVREGEPGDTFYMIEEGTVEVSTEQRGAIGTLRSGNVFGELALLFDKPRQATIRAVTDVKMCVLGRANFANYLGPFEEILRRNAAQYKQLLQSAAATA
jgi:cAMP-dependent protein kinase regulator